MLQSVTVLLVTVHRNEISIIRKYLQPLDGHEDVYRYKQGRHQTEFVTYYIGKYGACSAAIRYAQPGIAMHHTTSTVPTMAYQCFPYLCAIVSIGIACGIKKKVQMCDVLVSSQVLKYDKAIDIHQEYLPKGKAITVSSQLLKLFTQCVQWPDYAMKKYLKDHRQRNPKVKLGVILSGPYPVDDPALTKTLVKQFADEGIGIEMDGAFLYPENQQTTVNNIIVKAVCDFGDGNNITEYHHTAALLAADLVHKCLSDPHAAEFFKGAYNSIHIIFI